MISIGKKNLAIAGVIWGISLIVFALVYMFVLKPQNEQLDRFGEEVKVLQDDVNRVRIAASESAKENLKKEIDDLKTQLGGFVVKTKDDIQRLASIEIYNLSRDIGLDAFHIDPWNGVEVPAFSECKYVYGKTMSVGFNSTYTELGKFINMLERYKTVIFVDNFSINRASDEKAKHKVEMNLVVLVEKTPADKDKKG